MERQNAELVVGTIISDLTDRRGLRHEWEQIDKNITDEIRQKWIAIVEGEDDPEKAVGAIVADLSGRKGLDNEWEQIDEDIQEEIRKVWGAIFKKRDEIAEAVRDQLPAEIEKARPMLELDPEVSGIANEDELREHAVRMVLIGVRANISRELEKEQG